MFKDLGTFWKFENFKESTSVSGFHCSGKYIKIMLCKGKGDLTENTKKKYKELQR